MGSDARSDAQSGRTRWWLCAALWIALTGCAGGGGGDSVPGVEPEAPPPPTQTPPPGTPPAVAYAAAGEIVPFITNVDIPADGRPVVNFQLADGDNFIIVDLAAADIRFVITKLQTSPLGNLHGIWQSYLNEIEAPGVGPGTEQRLQATYERATSGTLTNNGDGTYEYRFAQVITDTNAMDPDVVAQAQSEGLDLTYDPMLTHRVSMQFDNAQQPANPFYDFLPSTGATSGILQAQIVTRTACNDCHDRLSFHGGNRIEMEYCVTCHNPGTTDANSGNSADFAEMTHKLHYGRELPSVQAGGSYQFYGFQDRLVDYSTVGYPQDIRNCSQCHAGPETAEADDVLTPQGDNWAEYPTRRACGACHDDLDFALHFGGQIDDENCRSCHALGGAAGSVEVSHEIAVDIVAAAFEYRVLAIGDTGQAEFPVVDFQVVDPTQNDAPYDIMNDPAWTQPAGASRLAVTVAWSTDDYTNTGNAEEEASSVVVDALATATDNGDGSFRVVSPVAIPDGTEAPFVAATGSGVVTIEGHPAVDIGTAQNPDVERIGVTNAVEFFSIGEVDGVPVPRREITSLGQCNDCHARLIFHGENRTDAIDGCVTCHNPRNTDRNVREIALVPPTDGKQEESIDFKTMIHAIHAAAFREEPLQVVGFLGFFTAVYDDDEVHYPGLLQNCLACHTDDSYALPLPSSVLGTSVDTGADREDPADDIVESPVATVCASCHDDAAAMVHMEMHGGDFQTTQAMLDAGITVEGCNACHAPGGLSDVALVHDIHEE